MKKLNYIGKNSLYNPVYKDESGKWWIDISCGCGDPDLYSASSNTFDGEPDIPMHGEYEIVEGVKGENKGIKGSSTKIQQTLSRRSCVL